jgi:hypothetical protein
MPRLGGQDAIRRRETRDARAAEPIGASLFELIWESMADVLGTAATATLLRRALKRAARRHDELSGVVIGRNGFDYEYRVPETWQQAGGDEGVGALRELVRDLQPLLVEMTGQVVVRRLARVGPLRELGIVAGEESET